MRRAVLRCVRASVAEGIYIAVHDERNLCSASCTFVKNIRWTLFQGVAHAEEVAEQRAKAKKSMDSGDEAVQAPETSRQDSNASSSSSGRSQNGQGARKVITSEHEMATIDLLVSSKRKTEASAEGKASKEDVGARVDEGGSNKSERRKAQDDYEFNEGEELVLQVRRWSAAAGHTGCSLRCCAEGTAFRLPRARL